MTDTYLIDAALENEATNWGLVSNGGNHAWNGTNKYHESWHNTFTLTQTTTALPAGYYQLSIQVAVEGGTSTTISLQATSGSNSSVSAYPKYSTHSSYADMAAWWAADATATSNRNLNRIFTTVYVEDGHTLTATFKQTDGGQWCVYGQIQLHKLTDTEGAYAQIFEAIYNPMTNLDMSSGRYKQRFEDYTKGTVTGKKLVKTISGLPKGKYSVTLNGGASYTSGRGFDGNSGDNLTSFYANDASTNVTVVDRGDILNGAFVDYTASGALVTDGNLEVGYNNSAIGANWFVGSVKYIEYVDPYVSELSTDFTSDNTMEAGQWYSFTVSTDGDYTLSATDGIVYTVEDALVSQAQTATSTVALKAGTAYFKSATSQPLTITYVNPVVENGTYFLYDETNKVFLSRGNSYGTEASLDLYGVPFVYNNYEKTIRFVDDLTNGLFTNTNNDFFTDGTPAKWAFEETEGGLYLRDGAKTKYVKKASSSYGGEVLKYTDVATEAIVWTLKSKTEHDAIIADYPTNNKTNVITSASLSDDTDAEGFETWLAENRAAKYMTARVGTAKFAGSVGDWTWNETNRKRDDQPAYGTDFAELFSVTGNFTQTIEGLAEGVYKVTINAFEREKGYADCNTLGAAGWEIVTAYFEANGEKVQLKSWYSEKEGTSNPNNTTEAATAFNNDKYKNVVFAYVGSDGKLTLKLAKPSYIWDSWVLFNNVTLTYYDSNVSDEDATNILAEADTQMNSPMKHSLYAALYTAKTTFEGAKTVPNYNALRQAIDNTTTSVASYASMYNNYLLPISNMISTTNFVDKSSSAYVAYQGYKDAYDNYTDDDCEDVENATANGLNIEYVKNTGTHGGLLLPNWKLGNTVATTSGCGLYINWWSTENEGTGDAKDFSNPFFEYYVGDAEVLSANTITGTLTGLKANQAYSVTANVRVRQTNDKTKVAGSITMEVVGGEKVDVTAGNQIGETARYINSYTATGVTDAEGKLELKFTVAANSNINWLSFRDVNYEESDAEISNNFTDLKSAITDAENDHKLGFEKGEYAPYTNLASIEAIAVAKAFDTNRYYIPSVITTAATAVSNATWTANETEMNAIYNPKFALSNNDGTALGWSSDDGSVIGNETGNQHSRAFVLTSGMTNYGQLAAFGQGDGTRSAGYFRFDGTNSKKTTKYIYGATTGYTIPLEQAVYRFTAQVGGWGQTQPLKVALVGSDNTEVASSTVTITADNKISDADKTAVDVNFIANVPVAGNYKIVLSNGNTSADNAIAISNLSLMKAVAENITINETDTYVPAEKFANVTFNRTLVEGWNGLVLPFDMTVNEAKATFNASSVKDFGSVTSGENGAVLNFVDATEIKAGRPFMLKAAAGTSYTINNVLLTDDALQTVQKASEGNAAVYTFTGTYAGTTNLNDVTFFLINGTKYYYHTAGVNSSSAKAFRAYFVNETPTAQNSRVSFNFGDDVVTGISSVETSVENGAVYNLNGQRVDKAQKGLYIVNGKKVVIK